MKLILFDINTELTLEWAKQFNGVGGVTVDNSPLDSVIGLGVDALVSPANSFGYMDGGIDGVYTNTFGKGLQNMVQAKILAEHDGELPVGKAIVVGVPHRANATEGERRVRSFVIAPTMRVPGNVAGTPNVYLASRAAFNVARRAGIGCLAIPGMGTGVGGVSPAECAYHMRLAWEASEESHLRIPSFKEAFDELNRLGLRKPAPELRKPAQLR